MPYSLPKWSRRRQRAGVNYWPRRTSAGVAVFSPLSLSPALWLKADAGTLQTVGGSAASADGDLVGQWLDQSGNGNHAGQTSGSLRPTLKLAIQNGLPVIRLDGIDDFFNFSNFLTGFTEGEIFIVLRVVDDNAANGLWDFGSHNAGDWYPFVGGDLYDAWGSTTRRLTGNPTLDMKAWHVYNVTSKAGEWTNRFDSVQFFTTGTNTVGWTTTPKLGKGAQGGVSLTGDIGEVLIFSSVPSGGNRALVEGYLRNRWGTP